MKLAIFDVDGTLVDSRAIIVASLQEVLAAEGLPVPGEAVMMSAVGLSLEDVMRTLVPGGDRAVHLRLGEAYKQALWQHRAAGRHDEALFEGAYHLLGSLRARGDVTLAIATGKSRRGVAHVIEQHGLEGWFSTVQTADDHPSKPHPSMVLAAIREAGTSAAHAIVIGDTSFDMAMARAAGAGAVGVSWGNHLVIELQRAGAHAIASSFAELEHHLDALWQERLP